MFVFAVVVGVVFSCRTAPGALRIDAPGTSGQRRGWGALLVTGEVSRGFKILVGAQLFTTSLHS